MGWQLKVLLWCWVIGVSAGSVVVKGAWREGAGWDVTCAWETWLNDSLQSVRLFRNHEQYAVFRPETNGPQFSQEVPSEDFTLSIKCRAADARGQRGACVTRAELRRAAAAAADTLRCEVSGEGPRFRLETMEYTVFVPPSDAEVHLVRTAGERGEGGEGGGGGEGSRRVLNCTASGLPAPRLVWTADGEKNPIPADFSGKYWNATSRLWHAWASLRVQAAAAAVVRCAPEAAARDGRVERGRPAEYRANDGHLTVAARLGVGVALALIASVR